MNRYLITSVAALFLLLALVALVEIIWNQEPEQPVIETPAATTTPSYMLVLRPQSVSLMFCLMYLLARPERICSSTLRLAQKALLFIGLAVDFVSPCAA